MGFKHRIGIDLGRGVALEDGIAWAASNGVFYCDAQTDIAPNAIESFDDRRCGRIADACARHGVHLGLHTLSAVNIAEISPFVRDAADQYLMAYTDLAVRLKAKWVVVHGGYHFTSDHALRKQASIDRVKRAVAYAEKRQVQLLLENLNGEPERAEVTTCPIRLKIPSTILSKIRSPYFQWAFTINHAHYDPIGIKGFIAGMDMSRCAEVRLADNNGLYELHLPPGTGTGRLRRLFRASRRQGSRVIICAAGAALSIMLCGREYLVECAKKAGVA